MSIAGRDGLTGGNGVNDALTALIRPRTICVVGVSAQRRTRGNFVINNLQKWNFQGKIVPINARAGEVEGIATIPTIEDLPRGIDVAFVAVPAPSVADIVMRLDRAEVRSAIVITAGFSHTEEAELRARAEDARMLMQGPNCMGLINVSDSIPIYTAGITSKVRRGNVALLAQSGSAAIAIMNSVDAGFSKVVTVGSEYRLTATDYLGWLATDDETSVVGVILESIRDPDGFAEAVRKVHAANKSVVVLKVGRSANGMLATQAHTGAMLTAADAYDCFFRKLGVPTVSDYEQLAASLTCLASLRAPRSGGRLAIVGISGGETALACDIAAELDIPVAAWSADTAERVRAALPGTTGRNPLDIGASVGHEQSDGELAALTAIANDPGVDIVLSIQDSQASLPAQLVEKYRRPVSTVAAARLSTKKPIVVVSPTPDATHPELLKELAGSGVPLLRGLRAGLAAMRSIGISPEATPEEDSAAEAAAPVEASVVSALKQEIGRHDGVLPAALSQRILSTYGIPFVESMLLRAADDPAINGGIRFPVVVKVSSAGVPHRSDVGGVRLGIGSVAMLRQAITEIEHSVHAALPQAVIDGYEVQEEMTDCLEALAGFKIARPFGAMTIVGTGGVLAELQADHAATLGFASPRQAAAMISKTRLGKVLAGYRNLIPATPPDGLALLVSRLTRLAGDLASVLGECDLNPVLIRKGSGEAKAADVLMVAAPR
jgi:acetate---CoA ligase (ADP-forming)